MSCTRFEIIDKARDYVGVCEGSNIHYAMIDLYNSEPQLPRGYKVKYTDAWCATFISVLAILCNAKDIIDIECGCGEMIKLATKRGTWEENDSYCPNVADLIFYDWNDNGIGENKGYPKHVGIVENCCGNKITVIEGNYDNQVKRRVLNVNDKYIRGYITPNYEKEETEKTEIEFNVDYAKEHNDKYKGKYVTTTTLNLRTGASKYKKAIRIMDKGEKVCCYGYYTMNGTVAWLLVVSEKGNVGFCSSRYLKRV